MSNSSGKAAKAPRTAPRSQPKAGRPGKAAGATRGAQPARGRSERGAEAPARAPRRAAAVPRPIRADALGWREAVAATVAGLHYELVDVERAQRGLLRVTIDRIAGQAYAQPGEAVTVDDCEAVTRQLQYALEVDGVDYARLEVSSPGLDRPLRSEADFERFAGQPVHVTLKVPFEGRKSWQGELGRGAEAGNWRLRFKQGKAEQELGFRFDEVREARLVPVVDFKGRKAGAAAPAGAPPEAAADAAAAPQQTLKG